MTNEDLLELAIDGIKNAEYTQQSIAASLLVLARNSETKVKLKGFGEIDGDYSMEKKS